MASTKYQELNQQEVDHFLQHGWIKLENCFTKEQSNDLIKNLWTRLGMSPDDKSTWNAERINMPKHTDFEASDLAPRAWGAICDLLSGEDRIADEHRTWGDGLIVNLGTPEGEGKDIRPQDLPGWHVDGDFFVHYLDSPEQGLLVIPLFTDIAAGGGGTYICPGAIPTVAKHLHDHPEGVSPRFTPRGENPTFKEEDGLKWFCNVAKSMPDEAFVEATGKAGDIYLLHPLMLHSASNNKLRTLRVITNPPVSVNQPFDFNRADKSQHSLVERKTLAALGVDSLPDWKITYPRERVVPARLRRMAEMKEAELKRLQELKAQPSVQVAEISVK